MDYVSTLGERIKTGNDSQLLCAILLLLIGLSVIGFLFSGLFGENGTNLNCLNFYFKLGLVLLLLVGAIIMFVCVIEYLRTLDERNLKYKEHLTDEALKIYNDNLEYKRLSQKTMIGILEKSGKAIIDEDVRDKEHKRKIELQDNEQKADKVIKELELTKELLVQERNKEESINKKLDEIIELLKNK